MDRRAAGFLTRLFGPDARGRDPDRPGTFMGTLTPNKGYTQPTVGGDNNVWGDELNTSLGIADTNLGGVIAVACGGNTNIPLNSSQAQNLAYNLTGSLTGDIQVIWPAGGGFYLVANKTTGAYTLQLITSAGSAVPITAPQDGNAYLYYTDGTTFFAVGANATEIQNTPVSATAPTNGQGLVYSATDSQWEPTDITSFPSGTVIGAFMQAAAPTGWTQVTTWNDAVLRFVNDGSGGGTGGSWNITGNFGSTDGTAISQAQLPNYNLTVNDPTHSHNGVNAVKFSAIGGSGGSFVTSGTVSDGPLNTPDAATGISVNSAGSGQAHTHTLGNISSDGVWRPAYVNALVASKN